VDVADDAQQAEALYRDAAIAAAQESVPAGEQCREHGVIVCADCGRPIPAARLAAVPGATRCRECQEEAEG